MKWYTSNTIRMPPMPRFAGRCDAAAREKRARRGFAMKNVQVYEGARERLRKGWKMSEAGDWRGVASAEEETRDRDGGRKERNIKLPERRAYSSREAPIRMHMCSFD